MTCESDGMLFLHYRLYVYTLQCTATGYWYAWNSPHETSKRDFKKKLTSQVMKNMNRIGIIILNSHSASSNISIQIENRQKKTGK